MTQEEIEIVARAIDEAFNELHMRVFDDGQAEDLARAAVAALDKHREGKRSALLSDAEHLLMCAAENLRSADKDERRVEAAFRMASKLDALRASLATSPTKGEGR